MFVVRSTCRSCEGSHLEHVFSAGELPLPESLVPPQQTGAVAFYPLDVVFCRDCSLLQLLQTVPVADIYDDRYAFLTADSAARQSRQKELAESLIHDRWLDGNSFVMEIGSNDGSMLRHFQARGVPTLGIEPAPLPAAAARRAGIATMPTFFARPLAAELASEGRRAAVILALDVLSLSSDLHGFLSGIRSLLREDGIAIFEVPYVRQIIDTGAVGAISHERLCSFSISSLVPLLMSEQLHPLRCELIGEGGATLRVTAGRSAAKDPSVRRLLEAETAAGIDGAAAYTGIALKAESNRACLLSLLDGIKEQAGRIVGYGARGGTALTWWGVGDRHLDYVVDGNLHRQGWFLSGACLPVLHPQRLISNRPDYVLLLDRDHCESLPLHREFIEQGGRFIVPWPEPMVVEA